MGAPGWVGISQQLVETGLAHHACRGGVLFVAIDIDIAHTQSPEILHCRREQLSAKSATRAVAMHHSLTDIAVQLRGTRSGLVSSEILGQTIADEPQQLPLLLGQHGQCCARRDPLQVLANLDFGQMISGVGAMLENQSAERLDVLDNGLTNDQLAHAPDSLTQRVLCSKDAV